MNLESIDINSIQKGLKIHEIDIDRFDLYQNKFKKYDHEVPVLAFKNMNSDKVYELPKISPRLKDCQLRNWLRKNINNFLDR